MKVFYFLFGILVAVFHSSLSKTTSCDLRETQYGAVCVCTASYCDYLENPTPSGPNEIVLISTSQAGLRFSVTNATFNAQRVVVPNHGVRRGNIQTTPTNERDAFETAVVDVDAGRRFLHYIFSASNDNGNRRRRGKMVALNVTREKTYQQIVGFGGALTGTVSHILNQLSQPLQDHIYKSYFDQEGIAYNMLRMSIGGCDFDLEPWAYNEQPINDKKLSNFTKLDPRDEEKIQQLYRIKEVTDLKDLKIMGAAWSPPKWMKSNNDWTGISHLLPEYYQTWADYHVKFLELMAAKNISIWAISTGNEPLNGVLFPFFVLFMSLGWTPTDQAVWLNDYLGPTIKRSPYKPKIFSNDDQRYTFPKWFHAMKVARPSSLQYLDGLATHWYWDLIADPKLIDETHKELQNLLLLNTESCIGDKPWEVHGPTLGLWERGEQYMRGYLQNFQHSYNGWIDWNLVLDERGGPNYIDNTVDAPIIVNTTNRIEFYKQPIFYAIGHFAKFVPEGSVRIDTKINDVDVSAVGFKRDDGNIVLIVFNSSPAAVDIAINDSVRGMVLINIPARSMHTIVYN